VSRCDGCGLRAEPTPDWTVIDLVDGASIVYCPRCTREPVESVDDVRKPHDFRYFSHCATCAAGRPYTPRETKPWNGRM
jgi:hypothetical protein